MPENFLLTGRECAHCGELCGADALLHDDKPFCCNGCRSVYQILSENDMHRYYNLEDSPGLSPDKNSESFFDYLDEVEIVEGLLDFSNDKHARVTFKIPAIHCLSCVWLLENFYRLQKGISEARVNYGRGTLSLLYLKEEVSLREIAVKLASLGYAPDIRLSDMEEGDEEQRLGERRDFLARITVAFFCFGNIMISSFPSYFGLKVGTHLSGVFSWINLVLVMPVVFYSAKDYWIAARNAFVRKIITLDFPVFIGMIALLLQSLYEISTTSGEGYCDSLAGLIFFLLCGKAFQRQARSRLLFDRDYKSFFPVWATRLVETGEEAVVLDKINEGDRLLIRNNQLIPADCILLKGEGLVDYAFVTGEAEPQEVKSGDRLHAGGRQCGAALEVEVLTAPSRSYLTSLWESRAFSEKKTFSVLDLSRKTGGVFTLVVSVIAVGASFFHLYNGESFSMALKVFVAVAIVACPCALSLSAPFTFGFANLFLGRRGFYLKSANVMEVLTDIDDVVFDKTGTLSDPSRAGVIFEGVNLSEDERSYALSLARQSLHPLCRFICEGLKLSKVMPVQSVNEIPGYGLGAKVGGKNVRLGSALWLGADDPSGQGSVWLEVDGNLLGRFVFSPIYRQGVDTMVESLGDKFAMHLLSGDRDSERKRLQNVFPSGTIMAFEQKPEDKMRHIEELKSQRRKVLMVGDGLNDAGALQSASCGVAVADDLNGFFPACDVIVSASELHHLDDFLGYARFSMNLIRFNFCLSLAYNIVGLCFAVTGVLSPLICAVLMPLSSFSVLFCSSVGSALASLFYLRFEHFEK